MKRDGRAARTIAARLTSIKSFSKWLTANDKLARDPFATVSKPNADADRRRERRMLLPTEWTWLMKATDNAEPFLETPASERQLLYRLAVQTGLRSSELRSLGRGHFHLDGKSPFVKVVSGDTKNRKVAHQYIDTELAKDLAKHLATKIPGASAFALPSEYDMAGTDGGWVPFGPQEDAKRRAGVAGACDDEGDEEQSTTESSKSFEPLKIGVFAETCEGLQESAECPRRDSNPHSRNRPGDFKSPVSANSTTRANTLFCGSTRFSRSLLLPGKPSWWPTRDKARTAKFRSGDHPVPVGVRMPAISAASFTAAGSV